MALQDNLKTIKVPYCGVHRRVKSDNQWIPQERWNPIVHTLILFEKGRCDQCQAEYRAIETARRLCF